MTLIESAATGTAGLLALRRRVDRDGVHLRAAPPGPRRAPLVRRPSGARSSWSRSWSARRPGSSGSCCGSRRSGAAAATASSGTPVWVVARAVAGGINGRGDLRRRRWSAGDHNATVRGHRQHHPGRASTAIGYFLVRTQSPNAGPRRLVGLGARPRRSSSHLRPDARHVRLLRVQRRLPGWTHTHSGRQSPTPAAMYFLWVVHALYKGSFRDWNAPGGWCPRPESRLPRVHEHRGGHPELRARARSTCSTAR